MSRISRDSAACLNANAFDDVRRLCKRSSLEIGNKRAAAAAAHRRLNRSESWRNDDRTLGGGGGVGVVV